MDFQLSDDQRMLVETAGRFAGTGGRALADPDTLWREIADLGFLGLCVAEADGGLGLTSVEAGIVTEAFGRGLVRTPFIASAVLAAPLLSDLADRTFGRELASRSMDGSAILAAALLEPHGRYDLGDIETGFKSDGDLIRLDGIKSNAPYAAEATHLIVSARAADGDVGLFLVERDAPGVIVEGFPTLDGQSCATVRLDGVTVDAGRRIGSRADGFALLEGAVDRAIAALCGEAVGAMGQLCDLTFDYLKTRRQFGRPIGQFQALQHRAAEMLIGLEQSRSAAIMASAGIASSDPIVRRRLVSAAKATISRWSRFIGQQAVQLHGGVGITDALPVGRYFKRLTYIDATFGDASHHTERFADAG